MVAGMAVGEPGPVMDTRPDPYSDVSKWAACDADRGNRKGLPSSGMRGASGQRSITTGGHGWTRASQHTARVVSEAPGRISACVSDRRIIPGEQEPRLAKTNRTTVKRFTIVITMAPP